MGLMTPAETGVSALCCHGEEGYRIRSVKGCLWLLLGVGGSHNAGVSLRMGQFLVAESLESPACAGFFGKRFKVCTL